ncbi:MAG: DNA mismatch repair endonuclease MutL, partial [Bacteroidota bacterium]
MQNKIHLLPDALANQIAAGEVVQRPASVVKELLENAIDAGAGRVELRIKNAGKTLIQVSDNGAGMTAQDARMAFERHATSKIATQDDLFGIRTLGFRGEALASIAAVAQVNLKTRLQDAEIGVELNISASHLDDQKAWAGPAGSIFSVKNLFFNVPARRNFLKSNPVETRHILSQFTRIALGHPEVHLCMHHNDAEIYDLPPGTEAQRMAALFGQDLQDNLHQVEESTGYATINGLLGDPAVGRKKRGEQFFFVNDRFIKSNYLHHAISTAYEPFLARDRHPVYLIRLDL